MTAKPSGVWSSSVIQAKDAIDRAFLANRPHEASVTKKRRPCTSAARTKALQSISLAVSSGQLKIATKQDISPSKQNKDPHESSTDISESGSASVSQTETLLQELADGDSDGRNVLRRVVHCAVERERRERIKTKLETLKNLVPTCASVTNMQKLVVLDHAIAYIHHLESLVADMHHRLAATAAPAHPRVTRAEHLSASYSRPFVRVHALDQHELQMRLLPHPQPLHSHAQIQHHATNQLHNHHRSSAPTRVPTAAPPPHTSADKSLCTAFQQVTMQRAHVDMKPLTTTAASISADVAHENITKSAAEILDLNDSYQIHLLNSDSCSRLANSDHTSQPTHATSYSISSPPSPVSQPSPTSSHIMDEPLQTTSSTTDLSIMSLLSN